MRSAIGISIATHLLISLIALNWVSFHEVKYIPRQVYNVTLVTPQVQAREAPPVTQAPPPEPEPEPEEEMPPPPDEPKPRPKPEREPRKTVPTTQLDKTTPEPAAEAEDATQPETGEVTLDAEDFPFAHYISRMRRKSAANWRVPEGSQGEDRFCRIYFRVYSDGSVRDVTVEDTSGLFMFDQSAQRAVIQAAPMPPLPREYGDDYLGVHFSFAYRETR